MKISVSIVLAAGHTIENRLQVVQIKLIYKPKISSYLKRTSERITH